MAPKHYLGRKQADSDKRKLADISASIFRAQRLGGTGGAINDYTEVGIGDLILNDYTVGSAIVKPGDTNRTPDFRAFSKIACFIKVN